MTDATLDGAQFCEADLSGSTLNIGTSLGSSTRGLGDSGLPVNFTGANLEGASIKWSLISTPNAVFTGARMKGCTISTSLLPLLSDAQRSEVVALPDAKATPCFIATAACGGEHIGEVQRLRQFRDSVLVKSHAGRFLVAGYERASPPLARIVQRWGWSRAAARVLVVRPALWLANVLQSEESQRYENAAVSNESVPNQQ